MSRSVRLWVVLGLNLLLVAGLVVVGVTAHSLGVVSEGADYLADAAAIGVSPLAISLSKRPPTRARPHGYPRATAYAALAPGVAVTGAITLAAGGLFWLDPTVALIIWIVVAYQAMRLVRRSLRRWRITGERDMISAVTT